MKRKRLAIDGEQNIRKFFKSTPQERESVKEERITPSRKTTKTTPLKSGNILTAFGKANSKKQLFGKTSTDESDHENVLSSENEVEIVGVTFLHKMDGRGQISFEEEMARQAEINQQRYNRKVRKHSTTSQSTSKKSSKDQKSQPSSDKQYSNKEVIDKTQESWHSCDEPDLNLLGASNIDISNARKHDSVYMNKSVKSSHSLQTEDSRQRHPSGDSHNNECRRPMIAQRSTNETHAYKSPEVCFSKIPRSGKDSIKQRRQSEDDSGDPNSGKKLQHDSHHHRHHHHHHHHHQSKHKGRTRHRSDESCNDNRKVEVSPVRWVSQGDPTPHSAKTPASDLSTEKRNIPSSSTSSHRKKNRHRQQSGESLSGRQRNMSCDERVPSKNSEVSKNLFECTAYSGLCSQENKPSSDVESKLFTDVSQTKVKAGISKLHQLFKKNKSTASGNVSDSSVHSNHDISTDAQAAPNHPMQDNHNLSGGSRVAADGDSSCADSREQPNAAQSAENAEQPATGGPASSHSASSSPCHSFSGDVLDESDDDDTLAPSMLAALSSRHPRKSATNSSSSHNVSTLPSPGSPSEPAAPLPSSGSAPGSKASAKLCFSLDRLLSDKIRQDATDLELYELDIQLKEGLQQGGITSIAMAIHNEEEMLPEHKQELVKLQVKDSVILDQHPGIRTFHQDKYKQLFDEDVPLSGFGFVPGESPMDKQISTLPPSLLPELLTSDMVYICLHSTASPHALLTWLFHLMSVHLDSRISEGAFRIIYRVLQTEGADVGEDWVPSLRDISRVFMNFGAGIDSLFVDKELVAFDIDQLRLSSYEQPPLENEDDWDIRFNLQLVLQTICYSLQLRSHCYTDDDIIAMTTLICSVALDEQLNDDLLKHDFVLCMSALLDAFSDDQWQAKTAELCVRLPRLAAHHHNRAHLVSLMPAVPRGYHMQRHLAYIMLHQLIRPHEEAIQAGHVSMDDLIRIISELRVTMDTDYYFFSSVINLIDLAVGNEKLRSAEKVQLRSLIGLLRTMMANVREHPSMLDRTRVKDMMVRITAKWTFMAQSIPSKQKSIFAYTRSHSPQFLPIEKVQCSQTDEEEDAENVSQSGDTRDMEADQSGSEANDIDQSHEQEESAVISESQKSTPSLPEID